jgi:hypothetical protein
MKNTLSKVEIINNTRFLKIPTKLKWFALFLIPEMDREATLKSSYSNFCILEFSHTEQMLRIKNKVEKEIKRINLS